MLYINNISKTFVSSSHQSHLVLDDVSLHVPKASIFGLLGPNGAGKTTLIRIINRILKPDTGTIYFNGHPLSDADVRSIGYLPEERGLYPRMRVGEQALYLAQLRGLSEQQAKANLEEWFDRLEMQSFWNRQVCELSKGMQQKVQFAVTVAHNPQLLVLDEPFSGFDPVGVELLKQQMLHLRNAGTTIILSTHNMAQAEQLCDNIALINASHIVLQDLLLNIRSGRPGVSLQDIFIQTVKADAQ